MCEYFLPHLAAEGIQDERVRNALATNLSDLLRYQNMLCRYDAMALKSLDIFSVHGFPVGLIECESNLLGIPNGRLGGSTRNPDELTGNVNMGRDLAHFTEGLAGVFRRMNEALKPGAPLAFTYHDKLRMGDVKPTQGDRRCIAYGHVIRLAVWHQRKGWKANAPVDEKIGKVAGWIDNELGGISTVLGHLDEKAKPVPAQQWMVLRESRENYGTKESQLSFKVFTVKTLARLVDSTRIQEFSAR